MSLARPGTLLHWCTTGTRVNPSSGEQDAGYAVNAVPSSTKLNALLGLLHDWIAWLNNPDLLIADKVQVGNATVLHATRTDKYGASQMDPLAGFAHDTAASTQTLLGSGGTGDIWFDIPVVLGSRIKAVRVICRALGGVATDITAQLVRLTAVVGNASPSSSPIVTTLNLPAASANIQAITLTPTVDTIDAGEMFAVKIHGANTAGDKAIYAIEVDTDRVA